MSKVSSHFSCILCKQKLNFPPNTNITDFIILILQFYKNHEICEQAEIANLAEAEKPIEENLGKVVEAPVKKNRGKKK